MTRAQPILCRLLVPGLCLAAALASMGCNDTQDASIVPVDAATDAAHEQTDAATHTAMDAAVDSADAAVDSGADAPSGFGCGRCCRRERRTGVQDPRLLV